MATEEESIEVAGNARRERLRALRTARELSDMPDEDPKDSADCRASGEAMATEDSVEQAAASGPERLKKALSLRAEKELLSKDDKGSRQCDNDKDDSEGTEEDWRMNMKFRNYLPHDKQLQEGKLAPAVLPKFEEPVASAPVTSENIEDPFLNIAPKKPNWDLRRDVQKRLDKLERRTSKAIYELMQEQEKEKEAMEINED